ncbi:hypothetical protein M9H77_35341 [Catharanthus roseus]|uniref:Uncharacterized protein n=1 Tax=Catharanthus roseus TaxID=4058 RepID=A0ACB9ZQ02_CATRO|nr:hypothetical protein M9H77_35341 [Catharanthus roseus]
MAVAVYCESIIAVLGITKTGDCGSYLGLPYLIGRSKKDFECFNLALLAKECWHIIFTPSSLVALCLQAKYFSSGNFFDASLGHKPSYLWRSLLEGRNILSLDLHSHVGNGLSTKI